MTATGYTRQSAGTITTGATILASGLNAEFNQMVSAFDSAAGHDHSGGAGLSQPIPLTTSVTGVLPTANGGTGVANASTFTLGGNTAFSGAFTFVGTVTANTTVTFPVTGTLSTLAGSETLTNKTLTSPTINSPTINSPTLVTPALGTPASGTLTNCTFPTLNQNTTGSAGSVAAGNITGTTLASSVTTSSLVNFGGTGGANWNFVNSNSGGLTDITIANLNTTNGTQVNLYLSTGTSNAFTTVQQNDGTTPFGTLAIGSGNSGGLIIDGSAATASSLALKSGSGGINFTSKAIGPNTFTASSSGNATYLKFLNAFGATGTAAGFEGATGTSNSFFNLFQIDGANPYTSLTVGSGATGGLYIDTSAASTSQITIKSGSGGITLNSNGTSTTLTGGGTNPSAIVTTNGSVGTLVVQDTGTFGGNIKLVGNGSTTPNKFIRSYGGVLDILSSSYGAIIFKLDDSGNITNSIWQGTAVAAAYGGTGIDTSASTGISQVSSGTHSVSTALANGTTATTQSSNDSSTKVATTAYVDTSRPLGAWSLFGGSGIQGPASTDLLVVSQFISSSSTLCTVTIKTDSSTTPTTVRSIVQPLPLNAIGSVMCPVKKGDYWRIDFTSTSSETTYVIPLGV